MSIVYLNGEFLDENEAKVSINDAGYYYGDGFYEVIYIRNGKLIDKELHFERLMSNFSKLYFKNYPSKNEILSITREVLKKNNTTEGNVYLQFTRGCTQRSHEFSNLDLKPTMIVKVNTNNHQGFDGDVKTRSCCIIEDPRRMHCEIKMISLLPMVLAKYEAEKSGFDDVIFYNSRCKSVTEGSSFNVFIVSSDDKIITCPLGNHILPGCTRTRMINIIKENGYDFEERFYSKDELYEAKEVFITASLKIDAITKVDGCSINEAEIGDLTKTLRDKYREFLDTYVDE